MSNFDFSDLAYNPETGLIYGPRSKTRPIGTLGKRGYIQIAFRGKRLYAHRVAWAIAHGRLPEMPIDHINGDKTDNRLSNLREVTRQENIHNQTKPQATNKSGYLGVCWNKRAKKWQAGITVEKKAKYLGLFSTAEEAHAAYLAAKLVHHPTAPR